MKIVIVGAGPAGLYCGLLLKKTNPTHDVTIIERNPPDVTYGWGLVFSEHTLGGLQDADAPSASAIAREFVLWDALAVRHRGETVRVGGQVFAGIARRALLSILARRCEELGVTLRHGTTVKDVTDLAGADIVVAADGANSAVRQWRAEAFGAQIDLGKTRYIWLGTTRGPAAYTLAFHESPYGLFQAHSYPFDEATSAFIVECNDTTWKAAGLDRAGERETIDYCERLFGSDLNGRGLLSNHSRWTRFGTLACDRWSHENVVLLGDAAHTAHFSIGSGTKLAMEDAVALVRALETHLDPRTAFAAYEAERRPAVAVFQQAARTSQLHFENLARYLDMEPVQFTFHLLTRSGWTTHATLRARAPQFVDAINRWFASAGGGGRPTGSVAPPPMLVPFRLGGVDLANRMVFAGGRVDATPDGRPTEAAAQHYAALARVGAALVMTEPVAVAAGARLRPEGPGLYDDAQVSGWNTVAASVHAHTQTRLAVVLTHAARPLPAPPWTGAAWPRILEAFGQAARRAHVAGADVLLLDAGPGTLPAQAVSEDGRDREAAPDRRFRALQDIVTAARDAWPAEKPVGVCLAPQGPSDGPHADAAVAASHACRAHGLDVVHVGLRPDDWDGAAGRQHVIALADRIRHEVDIPVIAGCAAFTIDEVNSLLAAGRADLCIINVGVPPTS
jgi:anthraniloyl-CoA monooxygenase